jgi:PAS domain S-box-containing protein
MSEPAVPPLPDLVCVCAGEGGTVQHANDAFLALTGATRESLAAGDLARSPLLVPDWVADGEAPDTFAWRHGFFRPFVTDYQRPDGSRAELLVTGAVTTRAPYRWVGCLVDLTALGRTLGRTAREVAGVQPHPSGEPGIVTDPVEPLMVLTPRGESARAAAPPPVRGALAAVLDASPTGAVLLADSGALVHVTPRLSALLGMPPARWSADGWRSLVHPEDRSRLDECLAALVAGRAGSEADAVRWRDARGGWRTLEVIGTRVAHGDELHFALHLHDREPERRAAREAVRAAMARRALLDAWPDTAAILFDAEYRCLTADGGALATLLAASGAAHVGLLGERLRAQLQSARDGLDAEWTTPFGGSTQVVACRACALRDVAGAVSGILLAVRVESAGGVGRASA